ncbi:MAG TPA: hypothetical protein VKP00_01530, partial [Gemmatimonadaceae bacterium]|nr:hypothetical protein [Gemmatimonadaceae bacterium]
MRICLLVTVATLAVGRDSARAQDVSVMVQAIPVVTRADPTATRAPLTEGYLSQPLVMAHASWQWLRGVSTLNLEGLTLDRGELTTGGYGEGYVDRRHPHAYVHELLAGAESSHRGVRASLFAGRGFAPFGSDDPMVRPFEKYPVNHHLAQVLERVVAVGALRYGPVIAEVGTFNGDEPIGPGSSPDFDRFGDSWASRLTVLPLKDAEVSASFASVASPEQRAGHGLDQRKGSVAARFSRETATTWRYAMLEWAHTDERDRGTPTTSLTSYLGEAAVCARGIVLGGRMERTDRPEEERLLDPFRTPRPSSDLANLGVSRWTTITASVSAPRIQQGLVSGRPFVEIARVGVVPGTPPGIFSPELRYGTRRMWMYSAGIRLRAGSMHDRMGRYGAAAPEMAMGGMGTHSPDRESDMMPPMADMPSSHET